jgi:uncharacterized Zn finger protein
MGDCEHRYIEVNCLGCGEVIRYELTLPTAIECNHCGMIFDARLGLVREESQGKK